MRADDIFEDTFRECYEEASSLNELSSMLGVHYSTARTRAVQLGLDVSRDHWVSKAVEKAEAEFDAQAEAESDIRVAAIRKELRETEAKYNALVNSVIWNEEVLAVAGEVFGKICPVEVVPPHIGEGDTEEDAMLVWADWHGGEVVDYDVMLGYNAYNPVVMCRRAQYTVDRTLQLLFNQHRGTTFKHLYVVDLGDGINGDHLPEQLATNALPVFEAMRMVVILKSMALAELACHIPVTYIVVPGNHGRRGQKMQWKLPTETADWLMGEMIRDRCEHIPNIEIIVPKAWSAGLNVRGYNHVLNHGYTSAKGGFGGISWYSFQRADGQKTAIESAHGKHVNYRWFGHIHQKADVPLMDGEGEMFIVGSLKGGDEYALESLNRFSRASQMLVGCHEKVGVSWRYPLLVDLNDEVPSRYEEMLGLN